MKSKSIEEKPNALSRRGLLIGGGIGAGLLISWWLWPRDYRPNLPIAKGEHGFGSWLKIDEDGRITIAVPQSEMGQGVYTQIAQIVAGELGADWRTVAVQPALSSPVFSNILIEKEWRSAFVSDALDPDAAGDAGDGISAENARRESFMITAGSSSVRAFEKSAREAGATARVLLCQAAAERWDTNWESCETAAGFVVYGKKKIAFADLVVAASKLSPPSPIPLNASPNNALSGKEAVRLDVAAKVDGSANFAGDIRLPEMLYASVRAGPIGDTRLKKWDKNGAKKINGVVDVVTTDGWIAVLGTNWWAANRALDALAPIFETTGPMPDSAQITAKHEKALSKGKGWSTAKAGSVAGSFDKSAGTRVYRSTFQIAPAVHAALETRSATAHYQAGRLTLWIATQAPEAARQAAAKAIGISSDTITLIPMMAGGSFGRNLDCEIAKQAAVLAKKTERPVQVIWSRPEDFIRDFPRAPVMAKAAGALDVAGRVLGLSLQFAVQSSARELAQRLEGKSPNDALNAVNGDYDPLMVEGAVPPYTIPNFTVDHFPIISALPTGRWRSNAHSYTAFVREAFIDELAHAVGVEPLSYRMQMLGGQQRLARCLTTVAALSGWDGGLDGSGKGIACHNMRGGYIAVVATARTTETGVKVDRISAVVDAGRLINPEIARQQIEGGIIFGLAQAVGSATDYARGLPTVKRLRDIGLPQLSDVPEIEIEFIRSEEEPAGIGELGVPAVAPAIANALFSAAGVRLKELPLLSRGL